MNRYDLTVKELRTALKRVTLEREVTVIKKLQNVLAALPFLIVTSICIADSLPDSDTLEKEGATIGKIIIERVDVFDPGVKGEDRRLFKFINLLHLETHESVIRRVLLFKEGDRYVKSIVEESARNIRKLTFLYTAHIEPIAYHDGIVDLKVYTQDAWTAKIGVNVGRKGGVNTFKVSIEDSNFLGFGKGLSIDRFKGIENSGTLFMYNDTQLLGTRWHLASDYEKNTDGKIAGIHVGRPFFSLDTRWSFELDLTREDQVKRLYHHQKISNIFRRKQDAFALSYGRSEGLKDGVARRRYLYYSYKSDRFSDTDDPRSLASPTPEDRTTGTIGFTFERTEDSFIKVKRYNTFKVIEDFSVGNTFSVSTGFSSSALGATKDGLFFGINDSQGFRLSRSGLMFLGAQYGTRVEQRSLVNAIFSFSASYFNTRFKNQTIFVKLASDIGQNLYPEDQFLLGGDTGLRGYPVRFLDGSRQLLFSVEDRIFTDLELFHLINVGMAVFFDAGTAWNHQEEFQGSAFKKDVGFGFRFGNRRSSLASVVHVDLTYPIDEVNGKRKPQLSVMTTGTF